MASSSARSKHSERVVAQTTVEARLHTVFEGSQRHFEYSSSVSSTSTAVSAYLQNMYLSICKGMKCYSSNDL
jgi:hypothetical protein